MKKKLLIATVAMSTMMSMNVLASGWQQGGNGWWYATNADNSQWYNDGWHWIDGDGDGTEECYYFDSQGWLLTGTTTPDGFKVNENGAWVVNGAVQTRAAGALSAVISESDFVVGGENSVTQNNADHSVISNWKRVGFSGEYMLHVFVTGDSLVTARGIALGASREDVTARYGGGNSQSFNPDADFWYNWMKRDGMTEANVISTASLVEEYRTDPYGIRFYYAQDKVIGVVFFMDKNGVSNIRPAEGAYKYCETAIYKVEADNSLTFTAKTRPDVADAQEEYMNVVGRMGAADNVWVQWGIAVNNVTDTEFSLSLGGEESKYVLMDGFWYWDLNEDGVLSEEEKGYTPMVVKNGDTIESWGYYEVLENDTIAYGEGDPEWAELTLEGKYGWGLGTRFAVVDTIKLIK